MIAAEGISAAADLWKEWWAELKPRMRGTLVLSGAAGVVVGLLVGLVLPRLAMAVVMALMGVLLVLPVAQWFATSLLGTGVLPKAPRMGMIVIVGLTIVGALLQSVFGRPKAAD